MLKNIFTKRFISCFQPSRFRHDHTRRKEAFIYRQLDKSQSKKQHMNKTYDPYSRNVYRKVTEHEDDQDTYADEQIEDQLWTADRNFNDFQSEEEEKRLITKKRILKRKERARQGLKDPNILTWAARAQIRFLHAQDQYQWTPDVLAESFPVSRETIIAILRSRRLPEDEKEIERHDRKVYRNWLKLKSDLESNEEPFEGVKGRKLIDGRLSKIINAAGIPGLPVPSDDEIVLTRKKVVEMLHPKVVGPFSSIISDYKAQFKKEADQSIGITDEPSKIVFAIGDKEAVSLLSSISSIKERETKSDKNQDKNNNIGVSEMQHETQSDVKHNIAMSESDKSQQVISNLRQNRRQRRLRQTNISQENLNQHQMLGTGKVS